MNRGSNLANITTNAAKQVSANRCHLKTIVWHNTDGSARFMQIFNKTSANVTVGTTTPDMIITIAATTTQTFDFGEQLFGTALSYAITTTATGSTTGTSSWVAVAFS